MPLTKQQDYLLNVFETTLKNNRKKGLKAPAADLLGLFLNFPFAAIARSEIRGGRVTFVDFSESIENIVGFTREEMIGRTLEDITAGPVDQKHLVETLDNLKKYKFCPKSNTNHHKDGHTVRTIGFLFEEQPGKFIELVVDFEKFVYYDN